MWKLDYKLKSVVILYYIEGYSVKETAQMLNISQSACKKRLERARKTLKEMVKKYFDVTINDSWEFYVVQAEREVMEIHYPEYQVVYDVVFEKNGPVSQGYHLVICGDNSQLISINNNGYVTAPDNTINYEDAIAKVPQGKNTVVTYSENKLGIDVDDANIYSGFNTFMDQTQTDFCYFMILDDLGNGYRLRWSVLNDEITEIKFYWDIDEEEITGGSIQYTIME